MKAVQTKAPKVSERRSNYVTAKQDFDLDSWCLKLWTNPKAEVGIDTNMLFGMVQLEAERPGIGIDHDDTKLPFLVRIVAKRFKALGQKPSASLCWFVASTCKSPGQAVMLCVSLSVLYDRRRVLEDGFGMAWIMSMFVDIDPDTFLMPSEDDMEIMWDEQKHRVPGGIGDNLLDTVVLKEPEVDTSKTTAHHPV